MHPFTKQSLIITPQAATTNHLLLSLIGSVVAIWSYVDGQLGASLSKLLGTNAEIGATMYSAIISEPAKVAVMRAVAESVLTSDELDGFNALLDMASGVTKRRNKVAHDMWAWSHEEPDGIVRIPQETWQKWHANIQANENADPRENIDPFAADNRVDTHTLEVWEEKDFTDLINDMYQLYRLFDLFWWSNNHSLSDVQRGVMHRTLWSEPRFQTAVDHVRSRRQKKQVAP